MQVVLRNSTHAVMVSALTPCLCVMESSTVRMIVMKLKTAYVSSLYMHHRYYNLCMQYTQPRVIRVYNTPLIKHHSKLKSTLEVLAHTSLVCIEVTCTLDWSALRLLAP